MKINECFVVYLFSKFHERLGFEKILKIQTAYPDCIAQKEGEMVTVEFETKSYGVTTHLQVAEYSPKYKVAEEDGGYRVYYQRLDGTQDTREIYPKNEFRLERTQWPAGEYVSFYAKELDLDYCVCWMHHSDLPDSLRKVKIIALEELPFIQEFMKNKGYQECRT